MSNKDEKYRHCHKRNNQKSVLIKKENFESLVQYNITFYIKNYIVPSCKFSTAWCPPASGSPDFAIQKLQYSHVY